MNGPLLLAAISGAFLAQVGIGVGLAFWRIQRTNLAAPAVDTDEAAAAGPGAWQGWRDFRVVRAGFEDRSAAQRSFVIAPVDGAVLPDFAPGQYLTFSLDLAGSPTEPARTIVRCYSLSDRPNSETYRVTIKRMPAPPARSDLPAGAASGYFHDTVREGDVLRVKAPGGQFVLDTGADLPAIFLAGGIGVTPMISMLLWSIAHQPQRRLHLVYGVRNIGDHAFKDLLEGLAQSHPAFRLDILYGDPGPDDVEARDYQHVGFIDIALLQRILPDGRHQFYVCGPPAMMAALVPALAAWGVPSADIHSESFGPASSGFVPRGERAVLATSIEVRFGRSRRTLQWTGEEANLLDFAERHGIPVDSGCRSGSCGSCETRLLAGEVHYESKPDYEVTAGSCLLCVATPVSALALEA